MHAMLQESGESLAVTPSHASPRRPSPSQSVGQKRESATRSPRTPDRSAAMQPSIQARAEDARGLLSKLGKFIKEDEGFVLHMKLGSVIESIIADVQHLQLDSAEGGTPDANGHAPVSVSRANTPASSTQRASWPQLLAFRRIIPLCARP